MHDTNAAYDCKYFKKCFIFAVVTKDSQQGVRGTGQTAHCLNTTKFERRCYNLAVSILLNYEVIASKKEK